MMNEYRLLTDDVIGLAIDFLRSGQVLPIHPAEDHEMEWYIAKIYVNKYLITVPVSNAKSDYFTGYNREGSQWSLVMVNWGNHEFVHFGLMPELNEVVAPDLCKKLNIVLTFKHFRFRPDKCERQRNKFSCGKLVIQNARVQTRLMLRAVSLVVNENETDIITKEKEGL